MFRLFLMTIQVCTLGPILKELRAVRNFTYFNIISSYTATSSKGPFPSRFSDGDPYHLPNVAAHLSGVPRNFLPGGGVKQIQLRTERTGIWRR